jgi:hypothetical protein
MDRVKKNNNRVVRIFFINIKNKKSSLRKLIFSMRIYLTKKTTINYLTISRFMTLFQALTKSLMKTFLFES